MRLDQINGLGNLNYDSTQGTAVAPWLSWGPYLWTNGIGPDGVEGGIPGRNDFLEWKCGDLETDGLHPEASGEEKVSAMLLAFFKTDPSTRTWFLSTESCPVADPGVDWLLTSIGRIPINDLGSGAYQPLDGGFSAQGGLYPGGSNSRPSQHETDGLAASGAIVPRLADGTADPAGTDPESYYALVSIGLSNTTQAFQEFKRDADADLLKHPKLIVVDGAQLGKDANEWAKSTSSVWSTLNTRLTTATKPDGSTVTLSPDQVGAAWVMLSNAFPSGGFPSFARDDLKADLAQIARNLKIKFPNLKAVYLSSPPYGGYSGPADLKQPEPYPYESGFSVKWLIEDQINNVPGVTLTEAPWLSWGPYLWADGLFPRADGQDWPRSNGLTWMCGDYESDGGHPSALGEDKISQILLSFFKTDTTTAGWFTSGGDGGKVPPSVSITGPATGATFTAPATITITATAGDVDGSVTNVEFFQGATKIGEDLSAPYSVIWSSVPAAGYSLTAKATDNDGASSTSVPVLVTVTSNLPVVSLSVTDAIASEPGTDTGTFTITRTGSTTASLAVNYTLTGSAINGADYKSLSGATTIPTGTASKTVKVKPVDDLLRESSETVTLTISTSPNYQPGTASGTVTITDNDRR